MIRKFKMWIRRSFGAKPSKAVKSDVIGGIPSMHPNCRHTVVPFVKKDK